MKKLALAGYGYWGPNLLRNFLEVEDCDVVYCCDIDINKLKAVRKRYPTVLTTTNFSDIVADVEIDGIIIAAPTKYHYSLAKQAIEAGKDVLIEKPFTNTVKEAEELVELARKNKKILMVDYTFLYHEAVLAMKKLIDKGEVGKILYIDSVRTNLGLFQNDTNVIFDLATHDFSIIQYLLGEIPKSVQAYGKSHYGNQEDVSYIYTEYPNNIFSHVHVSWLSPVKVRRMVVVGTKKMVVYDDLEQTEKIRIYDKGVLIEGEAKKDVEQMKIGYRAGDVWLPNVKVVEALSTVAQEFIHAITTRKSPLSDGKFGLEIVKVLEKTTESLRKGKQILL